MATLGQGIEHSILTFVVQSVIGKVDSVSFYKKQICHRVTIASILASWGGCCCHPILLSPNPPLPLSSHQVVWQHTTCGCFPEICKKKKKAFFPSFSVFEWKLLRNPATNLSTTSRDYNEDSPHALPTSVSSSNHRFPWHVCQTKLSSLESISSFDEVFAKPSILHQNHSVDLNSFFQLAQPFTKLMGTAFFRAD